ncbi:hypothetical protein BY996DRAFT_6617620 [Phakopsora pachyrhizi]|nr:hypothetical protein BY996DRAFT_6617620 [Phakopsora pachyrhizi]
MLPHSSKINLENAIKSLHIEVPDINSLLDKFTGELSFESFSVSQDSFYNQKIYDRFVYHLFLFHILKTQIKGAPEEIARRANEEIRNFEKVLGLFVAKMDLIKAIGYMGINYNLRFNGSIMNSMKAMEVFLRNSDDSEVIENFYEIEGMMLKRYKPHYILQNLPAWRNRLISSAKDLDDVKIDYRNYMSTVGKSNDIIQQKWMNSDLLNEMRVEFETQINPENFALKLIKFINKWERELRYAENPNSIKS